MTETHVTVREPDGTEKKIRNVSTVVGANTVHHQVVMSAKEDGTIIPPASETKQDTLQASVGATTDAEAASGDGTLIAILKACRTKLAAIVTAVTGTLTVGLPSDAATSTLQGTGNTSLAAIDTHLDGVETSLSAIQGNTPPLGQAVAAASVPVVLPAAQDPTSLLGSVTETAPATDTASSGLNGRLQRLAQRITSLIGLLPTSLAAGGGLKVEGVAGGVSIPTTSTPAKVSTANNSGSQVTLSTSVATLLASFSTRSGVYILADVDMFVKFGTGATTAAFKLEAGQPMNLTGCTYTGAITAILSTGTGTAYVMEW